DPRLGIEVHIPKPIDLPALEDPERLKAVEGVARDVEPSQNGIHRDDLRKSIPETIEFLDPPEALLVHQLSSPPVGDRSLREPRKAGGELVAEAEPPADRADGRRLGCAERPHPCGHMPREGL